MLQYLRENTGNWIIKIFLAIIVIVFVFLGVGSFGSKRHNSVAVINDEPITIKEYQRAYKMMIDQLRSRFGKDLNDDLIKALNVKQQVLDALINEKLVLAEADRLEIMVSDAELQTALMSAEAFQKDGKFDMQRYKRVLSQNAFNPETFEQSQMKQMRLQKIRNLITSSVNVSDLEAQNFYLYFSKKISLDYAVFAPSAYTDVTVTDNEVKAYYDSNKEMYMSAPKLKVSYLQFSPDDYESQVHVTGAQVKDYYEQHIDEYKVPEKIEARHILVKLDQDADEAATAKAREKAMQIYKMAAEEGRDFEKLAKTYSEGPSKDNGGYLGTFEKQMMVKPFADAAFAMKPGEISKPVKTQFGFHIIKVINKFDAGLQPFETVSKKIEETLKKEEMASIAYDMAGEAFDAVIDGDPFDQVALIVQKKIIQSPEFDAGGKGLAIPDSAAFAKEAFALPADDISDVKQIGDAYYLMKVDQRIEPAVMAFDQVKTRVRQDVIKESQDKKAAEEADAVLAKVLEHKSFDPVKKLDIQIRTTPLFTRNGPIEGINDSRAIIKAGFSLDKQSKIYPEVIKTSAGYYIVSMNQEKLPDQSEIEANLNKIKDQVTYQKQNQSYQAWVSLLRKQSEVKIDPMMFN